MYVYGHPDDMPTYKPGEYESEDDAIRAALAHCSEYPFNSLLAIYHQSSMVILAIVHDGIVYRPD